MLVSDEWVCDLVRKNDLQGLRELVKLGATAIEHSPCPQLALHIAVELDRRRMIPLLRRMHYDFDAVGWAYFTPIEVAMLCGHRRMALLLAWLGATTVLSKWMERELYFSGNTVARQIHQEAVLVEDRVRQRRWTLRRKWAMEWGDESEDARIAAEIVAVYSEVLR